jgi:hypothetical protein
VGFDLLTRNRRFWTGISALSILFVALPGAGFLSSAETPRPSPTGLLETSTLFAVYGRAFGVAPILGHLGTYKGLDDMAADTQPWAQKISAANNGKQVTIGIHLIYAMAVPCTKKNTDCVQYLSGDLVKEYIEPAAKRGWVVILDTQLGRSNPIEQIKHMKEQGYLKYDNVHVAIDPEFHASSAQVDPGIPVGTVSASDINSVQEILDTYVQSEHLKTKKILIVHQFGDAAVHDGVPFMVQQKKTLKSYPNVELVVDADGLGSPAVKIWKYNVMTDTQMYPSVGFRGIKIFFPNRWEQNGHFDKPPMTVDEIFGIKNAPGARRMVSKPNVIIIA